MDDLHKYDFQMVVRQPISLSSPRNMLHGFVRPQPKLLESESQRIESQQCDGTSFPWETDILIKSET